MKKFFMRNCLFYFLTALISYFTAEKLQASSYPYEIQIKNLRFEKALAGEEKFLTDFAIHSNDSYKTRTADLSVAEEVFSVSAGQIEQGLVEKLVSFSDKCKVIVGFYSLKDDGNPSEIELGHLFTDPKFFRKKIGTTLFYRAADKAKELGRNRMFWISDPDAEEFYLKMGAQKDGLDENLLNPKIPVPLFSYNLNRMPSSFVKK
ncbi:MAG: GNAT family N-acetyltransferase [Deltaproteobacteria bacterium]|nr:GNAT family N-acetyltransferase [Deltaproteobacteria bacterium]